MLAVTATSQSATAPLTGLTIGAHPDPAPPEGWTTVRLRAAALNHHDLWSLRGVGLPADRLPMVLGCDGAGIDEDGREVIVHAVVADAQKFPDETLDPKRNLLSELHDGTLAELVCVPRRNLVAKPAALSWPEAACLPTAWLTAYRMLFTKAALPGPGTVLIQGSGGGVATAALLLAKAAGHTVFVTSRDEAKRERALALGADVAVAAGERLPQRVDAVIETVGEATWAHSLKSLRPGGTLVVCGATSGANPPADLNRVFFLQLSVLGSTMGTLAELSDLVAFCERTGVRPLVDSVLGLDQAYDAFAQLESGNTFGKIVLTV
ncbi:MAG TPA: zinc-binding dehydrogenase [Mycobacteriales bacterium]|jgi:NADPH:quinone reductase-like Zn-dependent oxidoreductase|nr:zinc-binding dehydrogenase [Mycobacteriales bacterium]